MDVNAIATSGWCLLVHNVLVFWQGDDDLASPSQDGVPASYEAVYLIDALNGPQSQCTTNNTYTQTMPTTIPREYIICEVLCST